ncbi:MAG: hypothetical protein AB1657_02105 [Candidatus Micrarchaeota archaeon]
MRFWMMGLFVLGLAYVVSAVSQSELLEAEQLINSSISCSAMTDEQLELVGEYMMEQMHPGTAHTLMHRMMGLEEGSEEEELFHINLAKNMYCGDSGAGYMMGMGMMGGGMMGTGGAYGMMPYGYGMGYGYGIWDALVLILLLGLIVLVLLLIWKTWKEIGKGGGGA